MGLGLCNMFMSCGGCWVVEGEGNKQDMIADIPLVIKAEEM